MDKKNSTTNNKNTVSKYAIRLQENGKTQFSYRISKELFEAIKKRLHRTVHHRLNLKRLNVLKQGKYSVVQEKPQVGFMK